MGFHKYTMNCGKLQYSCKLNRGRSLSYGLIIRTIKHNSKEQYQNQFCIFMQLFDMYTNCKTAYKIPAVLLVIYFSVALALLLLISCNKGQNVAAQTGQTWCVSVVRIQGNRAEKLSPEILIERILSEKMLESDFELDTGFAFIKIGRFLSPHKSNALVIRFSDKNTFVLYELKKDMWEQVYKEDDIGLSRAYSVELYIEDYNFDGINDIGIQNEISNGASIRTFHLWLSEGEIFKSIPEFTQVGNPVLLKSSKTIHGYRACCAFSEYWLSEYKWINNNLINTREIHITNYPPGIEAVMIKMNDSSERKLNVSKAEISLIDSIYGWNGWTLVPKGNLSRYYRWFEK